MMLSVIQSLNPKIASLAKTAGVLRLLAPITSIENGLQQSRSISGKKFRDRSVKKPAPWPYKQNKFTYWHSFFYKTTKYFDENTRLIVVDGNIACGKTEFAKKLAEELEMQYFPEPSVDSLYIHKTGFDYRDLDAYLPKALESCDLKRFYSNPHHHRVGFFQMAMFLLRIEQYCDALAEMLNTGNGIVLERSAFSDFVFLESMFKMGYVSSKLRDYYNTARTYVMPDLVKPHLVIYLDVPVDILMQRIKERNNPLEVNSKVLSKEYLQSIEHYYKQEFLKDIENHSELVVYDWSNFGDIEGVVEDIERINFDRHDRYDLKMRGWRDSDEWYWHNMRRKYANHKQEILAKTVFPIYELEELFYMHYDTVETQEVLNSVPNFAFSAGSNPHLGESYLFKVAPDESYWERQKYRIY